MNKRLECLSNPADEEIYAREPLLAFSFYLSGCNNTLLSFSKEILEKLDNGFEGQTIHAGLIGNASALLWLWTLGAYEVIRTISQAKECFSDSFIEKVTKLKKELAIVRMPSAKMEVVGKNMPVNSNRSPDGWDIENKNLLIGSPENPVSARYLLDLYKKTILSLSIEDVRKRHQDSYR